jgi:hypothetical protein
MAWIEPLLLSAFVLTSAACGTTARGEPTAPGHPLETDAPSISECRYGGENAGTPFLSCPAGDLLVSRADTAMPLALMKKIMSAARGLVLTDTTLSIGGASKPAVRVEKPRSDGGVQIGWITIIELGGVERNITCYLRDSSAGAQTCKRLLSTLARDGLPAGSWE